MKETLSSSETSVLRRAKQRHMQEDAILSFVCFPSDIFLLALDVPINL
jgi:hypothetical protein